MSETPKLPRPSDGEIEILHELWSRGPLTVRQIHRTFSQKQELGYTTVLKMMQIMHMKGLVERDESARAHVYKAVIQEEEVQERMVKKLLDRVFKGSAKQLVLRALEVKGSSSEELEKVRKIIENMEDDS